MARKDSVTGRTKTEEINESCSAVEGILEKKLEDVVNFLASTDGAKSQLYDDILGMVERSLIKIALKRSNNIKSSAATFLGINRNTLHKKIEKLDIPFQD